MSDCNRRLFNVNVLPDIWSSKKDTDDFIICTDIWFCAKNVDDVELFTEIYPFTINKPLENTNDIDDNNAILTTKSFADNLSTPIDVDIVYFTKVKTDTETFSELKYFNITKILTNNQYLLDELFFSFHKRFNTDQDISDHTHVNTTKISEDTITNLDGISNSFNKPTYDNYNSIDNVSIRPLIPVFSSVNFVNDVSNRRFIKYIDTTGYYFDELYAGEDYIENNSIFISDYIRMINNCILSEISTIIEEPKINTNKYITDDTTIVNIDTTDLYSVNYLDINYFSGIYAGNFIQNLD